MPDQVEKRPFHETIVDAIRNANPDGLYLIADLLVATKIPKGHDEIVAVWRERVTYFEGLAHGLDSDVVSGTITSLLEQKQKALESGEKGDQAGLSLEAASRLADPNGL